MRFLVFFIVTSLFTNEGFSQQIEWTKIYDLAVPFYANEDVDQIIQMEDSTYIAVARVDKFGYFLNNFQEFYWGMGLVRLDKNGDSLYMKNIHMNGGAGSLAKAGTDRLLMGFTLQSDTVLNAKMKIIKTDYFGNHLWSYPFIGQNWEYATIQKVIPTGDEGCYAVGKALSTIPGNYMDGFLLKLNGIGQLDWMLRYSDHTYTSLNNMERMVDGNYLLSGTAGPRLWSIVVDSLGIQLSERTWFETQMSGGFTEAMVKQGHQSAFAYGSGQNSDFSYGIMKFDENGDAVWTKRKTLLGYAPYISLDGGYSRWEGYSGGNVYFRKYRADSSMQWQINLSNEPDVVINCMAYDGLGSAVLAGNKKQFQSNNRDMYFIKVSNVGYPVDPLSNQKPINKPKEQATLHPYPNPAERCFYLGGLKATARVQVFDLQGKKLGQYTVQPNEPIPVWSLKEGLYVWRAEDGKRVWSGKIVKR